MSYYEQLPAMAQQIPVSELWELIHELVTDLDAQAEARRAAEARVAQLEAEKAAWPVAAPVVAKTSQNSSLPPSSQYKGKCEKRQPPQQVGERVGKSRERQVADVVLDCTTAPCQHCGADLSDSVRHEIGRQQVIELPTVKAVVVELVRYERRCECGHSQRDQYPGGYRAPHQAFGPRLHAVISYLNSSHHLAHDRLRQVLHDLYQLDLSAGAIVNSLQYTARCLEAPVATILAELQQADVVGSDETGLRYEGQNGWLWVIQNEHASYFVATPTRRGQVLHDLFGEQRLPLWVCDLYAGQLKAPAEQFAVCNAHQLRDLQYAIDHGDQDFAPAMQLLLREGLLLTRQRFSWDAPAYAAAVERIKVCAQTLLEQPADLKIVRRLQKRFRKHFDKMWLFLENPDAPFDNNASERALRPAVIHRKVIGGFRSLHGAVAYARYRSVEDTARKRGQSIWLALFQALGQPLALPLHLSL